ncbi:MAG TPA: hypothetical protein VGF77_18170 [Allosphingosinicella sp.]
MKSLSVWAAATALAAAASAAGAAPFASFRVGGVSFRTAIPSGYCVPEGVKADVAQLLAAADDVNVTDLTLFRCAGQSGASDDDYILVKTPKTVLVTNAPRRELLDSVGEAFNKPDAAATIFSQKTYDESGKGVGQVLGRDVNLTGDMHPVGKDNMCAYLGGTLKMKVASTFHEISVGACITSVGNRVLTVYIYGPDKSSAGIAALLRRSKQFAQAIEVVPGD